MTDAPCSSKTLTSSLAPEALTKFRRCAFCSIEQKELYKCPRCQQEYCSLRCYKSQKHSACSESFYKDCVKEELQGRQYEGEKGAETFEEHMQKFLRGETEKIPGVQNPDPENEEEGELVDSDDEPEEDYLKRVVEGTIERYSENDDDIERQLIAMGLGSDVQQLLDSLTVEERAAFAQLAEEEVMNRLFIRPLMFCRRFVANPEVINPNAQQEVAATVSSEVSQPKNRLFAVVYVGGKQWKVTQDDLIVIFGNNPLKVGDEIKLEKVLMLGGKNFSLFGRPFLDRAKVHVDAVVVEKAPKYPELLHYCNQHYLVRIERWLSDMSTTLRVTKVRADDDVFQANTQ